MEAILTVRSDGSLLSAPQSAPTVKMEAFYRHLNQPHTLLRVGIMPNRNSLSAVLVLIYTGSTQGSSSRDSNRNSLSMSSSRDGLLTETQIIAGLFILAPLKEAPVVTRDSSPSDFLFILAPLTKHQSSFTW